VRKVTRIPEARVIKGGESSSDKRVGAAPADDIRHAPRELPPELTVKLLFGGLAVQAWWVAVICMTVALLYSPNAKPDNATYDATASGTVTQVEKTDTRRGKHSDPVLRVSYVFEDSAGGEHHGVSYADHGVKPNSAHLVEYTRANPDVSRLQGMRSTPRAPYDLIVLAGIGLLFVAAQLVRSLRWRRLLRIGVPTPGKIVKIGPPKWAMEGSKDRRVTVEYELGDQTHRTSFNGAGEPVRAVGGEEVVLYHPRAPARAVVPSNLPGRPSITQNDQLAMEYGGMLKMLVAPALWLIGLFALLGIVLT
jgi:hypothetical protein